MSDDKEREKHKEKEKEQEEKKADKGLSQSDMFADDMEDYRR